MFVDKRIIQKYIDDQIDYKKGLLCLYFIVNRVLGMRRNFQEA
jgi:hypothetical protein